MKIVFHLITVHCPEIRKTPNIFYSNNKKMKKYVNGFEALGGTDYLYIVDLKKNSHRPPPALLLSPDRADMDCDIDRLSREM